MAPLNSNRIDPPRYFKDVLAQGIRPDGRVLDECRPISINVNSFQNADGSAIVKIGNTAVVCGIKLELVRPKAETPDQGFIIPNVDLPPLCSGQYQPGPPCDLAQEATKFVDEVLHNSNCIDLKDLCIATDHLAWILYLDIICLNQDGNLFDASLAASMAALKVLQIPHVTYNPENGEKIVDITRRQKLNVRHLPVATTTAVFESNSLLSDPTAEEESLSSGTITVVIDAGSGNICGLHHPGTQPLKPSQLDTCILQAQKKTKAVAQLITTAVENASSTSCHPLNQSST